MTIHETTETIARQVALKDIDESPGPFCMSFGFDLDPLIQSIQQIGLANPPILKSDPEGLTVVAGYRRVIALKALGVDRAQFRIIARHDTPPLECLLLNLHDNLSTRPLNDVEKGMALRRLANWVPRHEIVDHYMPLLGLPSQENTLCFFLEMGEALGGEVNGFVAAGRLSWNAIKMLSEIDTLSRNLILRFISDFKFNTNQQSQFIDYIVDLSSIEDKSIPQILGEKDLNEIRSDTHLNRPQRAKAVLQRLRSRRLPSLVSAEEQFKHAISDLRLPDGICINAPPFFEGAYYRLEILFREGRDLKSRLEDLIKIEGLSQLRQPWEESPG